MLLYSTSWFEAAKYTVRVASRDLCPASGTWMYRIADAHIAKDEREGIDASHWR
jgi:hypothetical protein